MLHRLTLVIVACCLTSSASAGAWLRDKGSGFLAFSTTARESAEIEMRMVDYETSVYAEYGVLPKLTLGFDGNVNGDLAGHALIFARLPLADNALGGRFAFELGLGASTYLGETARLLKLALSYGRGFSGPGGGWLAIDAAFENRRLTGQDFWKLDATLGLPSQRKTRPLLQVETTTDPDGATYWSVIPSLLFDRGDGQTWLLGIESKHAPGLDTLGIKLGIWKSF
ncbi:MAG: hypothetical protein AAGA05_04245 [Pseudomonadota bacterium]